MFSWFLAAPTYTQLGQGARGVAGTVGQQTTAQPVANYQAPAGQSTQQSVWPNNWPQGTAAAQPGAPHAAAQAGADGAQQSEEFSEVFRMLGNGPPEFNDLNIFSMWGNIGRVSF